MQSQGCATCARAPALNFEFTFAFQPIVSWPERRVIAYEALVRGRDGAGAASVLSRVTPEGRYSFDQAARSRAIGLAAHLFADDGALLSINTLPNAIYEPRRCLRTTLEAATAHGFPLERLMFEMTEDEEVSDLAHLKRIVSHYRESGFTTAIDDFGKRFANLDFLVDFLPHVIKIDRVLISGVDGDPVRRAVLRGLIAMTRELGVRVVAEGVETVEELACLLDLGFDLFQGFFFARPALESLPAIDFAGLAARLAAAPRPDPTVPVVAVMPPLARTA
jgi:EAL domain-containing protein (putative c-di-GMP-specific phosphodiesterase class I)